MRSIVGVGMTPPKVLGTPNPESSVMMSRTFGACLGGTMRGAHQALDCRASSLITPPNFGSGAGSCLPLMVVVALGEPGSPVVWICGSRAVCADAMVAASAQTSAAARRFCMRVAFIGVAPRQIPGFGRTARGWRQPPLFELEDPERSGFGRGRSLHDHVHHVRAKLLTEGVGHARPRIACLPAS